MYLERLVRFVVNNRLFTLIFAFIILLAAWIRLPGLTVKQNPTVELPTLMITATLPGASAREIEQRVVQEIEDKLEGTRRLNKFSTHIRNSVASMTLEYHFGVDIDDEYIDINSEINNLKAELPDNTEVTVFKQSPIDIMVAFTLALVSDTATQSELVLAAEKLKGRLRSVPSVEDVELVKADEEVRIDLDISRLSTYGIDIQQVAGSIQANNRFLPTGAFEIGEKTLTILPFPGGYTDLEGLRNTILISRSNSALALQDVADLRIARVPDGIITRVDGRAATWITMRLDSEANVFDVREQLDQVLADEQSGLAAAGIETRWLYEVESGVAYKMTQLFTNIGQGIFILSIVLLFAVGYRSALVIALMLPMALCLSIVGLALTDYGLQAVSLAGFIIALGLIVDNGIVVTESTYKLQRYRKLRPGEAAVKGASSVLGPLISATLTTALAFAPLFLLTSTTGLFLRSLVATIWLCLAASLIVAVAFSALMLSRIGTRNRFWRLPPAPSFMIALRPVRDVYYPQALRFFIRRPWALLLIVVVLLWASLKVAAQLPVIVFPDSEEPFFTVTIEAPADRSLDYADELSQEISARVRAFEEVQYCGSIIGDNFPFVDSGIQRVGTRRHNAVLFCGVDFRDSDLLGDLVDRINTDLAPYAARARINASPFTVGGDAGGADIQLLVVGPRIEGVREQARALETAVRDLNLSGIRTFDNPANSRWFALDVKFKERVANALGVNRSHVDQVLILLTHGYEVDELRTPDGNEYPIVLRAEKDFETPLAVFDRLFVTSATGQHIPLSQVLEVSFVEDEYEIEHRLFRPVVELGINANTESEINSLTRQIKEGLAEYQLPPGYELIYEGQLAHTAEEFSGAGKYVSIVGLLILAIFVLQFKSVLQPLVVCAAIPLSFIGAFMLLYGWDQPLSFLAFIGLTSLMGIVVNNSILLVDEGNQLRQQNPECPIDEVAIQAGRNRFMPIILTSVTSIVGLMPLALGNTMFKALAIVVIGGLTTSTFLTLLCVPVLYKLVTRKTGPVSLTHEWSGRSPIGDDRPR